MWTLSVRYIWKAIHDRDVLHVSGAAEFFAFPKLHLMTEADTVPETLFILNMFKAINNITNQVMGVFIRLRNVTIVG
jgi:hypothetical protein